MNDKTPNERALNEVDWIIQESYKRAVNLRGITDWTNDFHSVKERNDARRDVEKYQIEIAKLIDSSLRNIKFDDERKEFNEKMDKKDAEFDKKYGLDEKKDIGTRIEKDETGKIDDRGTDEIGKT